MGKSRMSNKISERKAWRAKQGAMNNLISTSAYNYSREQLENMLFDLYNASLISYDEYYRLKVESVVLMK